MSVLLEVIACTQRILPKADVRHMVAGDDVETLGLGVDSVNEECVELHTPVTPASSQQSQNVGTARSSVTAIWSSILTL